MSPGSRLWHSLNVILGPAMRPLLQFVAAIGMATSVVLIVLVSFADPIRDYQRIRYLVAIGQIDELRNAMEQYRRDCGGYPDEDGALNALVANPGAVSWHGPYIQSIPFDPWGRPYRYLIRPNSMKPEIVSFGADGREGGRSFNADVSSQNLPRRIPESPLEKRVNRTYIGIWVGAWVVLIASISICKKTSRWSKGR